MIQMRSRFLAAGFALALATHPCGAAGDVGILIEHIELGAAEATALLHGGRPARDATALRTAVGKLIDAGEAEQIDLVYATGGSGQQIKVGSLHEFIYPTEWDPAEIPSEIEAPVTAEMDLKVPANPTVFEDRELGNTVEAKALVAGDGTVRLTLSSETAGLLSRSGVGNEELGIEVPQFSARRISGEFTCREGRPLLAGMFTPRKPGKRDRRVMVFATVSTRQVPWPDDVEQEPELLEDPFADRPDDEGEKPPAEPEEVEFGVQCGVEYVEIPQAAVGQLLAVIPADFETSSTPREIIDRLVERGEAKVLASAHLTNSGYRARVQPVHEFIYPSEYDAPSVVQKLTPEILEEGGALVTRSSPTAFVVRNLGLSVETESKVSGEGEMITVELESDRVRHVRSSTWGVEEAEAEVPVFETIRCSTEMRLRPGEEAIAAILTPRDDQEGRASGDRCVVILLWADVAKAELQR